jgi:hypothetical protein
MPAHRTAPAEEQAQLVELLEQVISDLEASQARVCQAGSARATALLRAYLTKRQWKQLTQRGYVEVASPSVPGRSYRIPRAGGMVTLFQHGRPQVRLCVSPAEALPRDDVVLLHLVTINGDEQRYLETANPFPVRTRASS